MRVLARVLRSPLWLALVWLLGGAHVAAAADAWVVADFDGDGHRDRAALDHVDPSVLRVWLSTTRSIALIRSPAPVVGIGARDLDGDRRDELLVGTRTSRIQVFTTRRHGLTPFRPWHARKGALARTSRYSLEDPPDDAPVPVGPEAPPPRGALPAAAARQPILLVRSCLVRVSHDLRSAQLRAPSGPRPPPLRA
jgi:hypothetical protein